MNTFTDYYAVLDVDVNASPTEIKAAFKRLARQYHPDVYKASDANERMSQLNLAYGILSDSAERELYNAQYVRHFGAKSSLSGTTSTIRSGQSHKAGVSSGARRDRQRHYAFPNLESGQSLSIDLVDMVYSLSSDEVEEFRQSGFLRGAAPLKKEAVYYCHRCHAHWSAIPGRVLPSACPKCIAPDWAEYLLLRCTHCHAIFESEQIRYAIGAYMYGRSEAVKKTGLCPPYELFPLCPYCGQAHWCPSEEERVRKLGVSAAKRAGMLRVVLIISSIVLLLLVAMFMLGGH